MSVKLITVDMDETFLRTDKSYDQKRFKSLYKYLNELGIIFLVASGMSYHTLKEKFSNEEKKTIHFAGDNGSFIVKNNQILNSIGMSRDLYMEILKYVQSLGNISAYVSTGMESYILESDPNYHITKIYNHNLYSVKQFEDIPKDKSAYKIAMYNEVPLNKNKELAHNINQQFNQIFTVTSGNDHLDILHKKSGKGYAIQYLQNKYNITPEETMIFGDSMNDHSMIPYAKYNISMSNADPEFAKHTAYTIGSNNDQAVLDVLEQLIEDHTLEFMEEYKN